MKESLITGINFSEKEYNEKTKDGDFSSFDEFINNILQSVKENDGTLEDAVFIANDAFRAFSDTIK